MILGSEKRNALMLRNGCGDQSGGAKTQKCIVRNGYGVQKERNNEGIETTQRLRRPEGAKNMNALKLRNGCGDPKGRAKQNAESALRLWRPRGLNW